MKKILYALSFAALYFAAVNASAIQDVTQEVTLTQEARIEIITNALNQNGVELSDAEIMQLQENFESKASANEQINKFVQDAIITAKEGQDVLYTIYGVNAQGGEAPKNANAQTDISSFFADQPLAGIGEMRSQGLTDSVSDTGNDVGEKQPDESSKTTSNNADSPATPAVSMPASSTSPAVAVSVSSSSSKPTSAAVPSSSSSSKPAAEVVPLPFKKDTTASSSTPASSNDADVLAALKANGITVQDLLAFSRALREEAAKRDEVEKFATQFADAADAVDATNKKDSSDTNKENTPTDLNSPPVVSKDSSKSAPTTPGAVTAQSIESDAEAARQNAKEQLVQSLRASPGTVSLSQKMRNYVIDHSVTDGTITAQEGQEIKDDLDGVKADDSNKS
jgi:hypothetical protein